MTRSAIAPLLVLGLAILGTPACGEREAPAVPSPGAPAVAVAPSSSVRWRPARSPAGTALVEAPARVLATADGRVVVTPPLRARIVGVQAISGSAVVVGAPLVEVALPEAAAAASSYLVALDQIQAYQHRADQLEELRKEGLARNADLAAIELELARLRGQRDVAATTLRAAGFAVGEAHALAARGGRTVLRAPRVGIVTKMTAIVGATASSDEALVEISGGGSTRVEALLTYALPPDALFEIETAGVAPTPARLIAIAPSREEDGTTRAWFEVETALPAGALGRLRAVLPPGVAVTIPSTAIGRDGAGSFVWKREGERPRRVAVRVLVTSGTEALVSGVTEGELVASIASAIATTSDGVSP